MALKFVPDDVAPWVAAVADHSDERSKANGKTISQAYVYRIMRGLLEERLKRDGVFMGLSLPDGVESVGVPADS